MSDHILVVFTAALVRGAIFCANLRNVGIDIAYQILLLFSIPSRATLLCDTMRADMRIFSYLHTHKVFFTTLIFVAMLTASFSIETKSADAIAGANPGGLAVGGVIAYMNPCTCAYTSWLAAMYLYVVGKPSSMSGTYTYSRLLTETHANYAVVPSSKMMGTYIPGVQACWMQAGYACFPLGNKGLITSIGTAAGF